MNGRERVLNHLDGKPVDHVPLMPITMMFAGDQIGAKYRDYATDFRVMVEAQIETARRFDFDYVSAISDPAREAADLGAEIEYLEDQPPAIIEARARLADKGDLAKLDFPDPLGGGRMHDRVKAIALFKERIDGEKLIEGWVEGPCAEAADLRGINTLMLDFFDDPGFVGDLFEFIVKNALRFAKAQVDAGADIIGVGDAAASLIGPQLYEEHVATYEQRLIDGIRDLGCRTRLHICGKTTKLLPWMGNFGADMVDLDWMVPFAEARKRSASGQVLSGNIDPVAVLRNGTPRAIQEKLAECHRDAGPRYIVCAGCEVVRDTPEENLRAMVDYAKENTP
jgi:MtaA/CmuA family methyltransferase